MNDGHDEANCPNLHPAFGYTAKAYTISGGSVAFERWFREVFSVQNPNAGKDFDFSTIIMEGEELLEVLQHNPYLSIESLESLFEASRAEAPAVLSNNAERTDLS
jgi:hypothetical protein